MAVMSGARKRGHDVDMTQGSITKNILLFAAADSMSSLMLHPMHGPPLFVCSLFFTSLYTPILFLSSWQQ